MRQDSIGFIDDYSIEAETSIFLPTYDERFIMFLFIQLTALVELSMNSWRTYCYANARGAFSLKMQKSRTLSD